MALTNEDIQAIASLVGGELEPRFQSIDRRFDEVLTHIDGLSKKVETFEQELLMQRHQCERDLEQLGKRVDALEKKVA